MELNQQVKKVVAEVSGMQPEEVQDWHLLVTDCDLDSLELFQLGIELENEFGIDIPDSSVRGGMTVGDLIAEVQRLAGSHA